jgi:hypothetical protein
VQLKHDIAPHLNRHRPYCTGSKLRESEKMSQTETGWVHLVFVALGLKSPMHLAGKSLFI